MFNSLPCIISLFFSNTYSCSLIVSILNIDRRRYSLHGSSYNVYFEIYEYTNNTAGLFKCLPRINRSIIVNRLYLYGCLFQEETFIFFVLKIKKLGKMMTILCGRRMLLIPIDQIYRPCKYRLATKFPDYKTTQSATIKCYLTEDFQTRCLKQNRMVKIMKHLTPSIKFHRYFFTE